MTTTTNRATPPTTVVAAFLGFLVSAVTAPATIALLIGSREQVVDAVRSGAPSMPDEQVQGAATVALGLAAGIALLVALVQLWLAFKLRAGRNRARVVLAVLTLVQVVSLVTGEGNAAGYGSGVVAVTALVLAYLPASNAYFAAVGRTR
ncbi:hypothetical protein [Saccharothrix sp. Mg75]|uniref:hypothetical protein n=1 Tax=Saccharothrix sp. Mg75 TaxID=3445357 RepID=UPI003EECA572